MSQNKPQTYIQYLYASIAVFSIFLLTLAGTSLAALPGPDAETPIYVNTISQEKSGALGIKINTWATGTAAPSVTKFEVEGTSNTNKGLSINTGDFIVSGNVDIGNPGSPAQLDIVDGNISARNSGPVVAGKNDFDPGNIKVDSLEKVGFMNDNDPICATQLGELVRC